MSINGIHLQTESIITIIIVGLIAGWLSGQIMKGKGFGLLGNLVVGIIGAFIGSFVFSLLGVSFGGLIGSIITATAGALLLLYAARVIKK